MHYDMFTSIAAVLYIIVYHSIYNHTTTSYAAIVLSTMVLICTIYIEAY
jgi:hypothetical protein